MILQHQEGDGPQIMDIGRSNWNILYFKRSFVRRHDGVFKGYMNYLFKEPEVLPMTYPIAEAYGACFVCWIIVLRISALMNL